MLLGTIAFPTPDPDFRFNPLIEEMDHAFEGPHEF
jgi:hypothetical protein